MDRRAGFSQHFVAAVDVEQHSQTSQKGTVQSSSGRATLTAWCASSPVAGVPAARLTIFFRTGDSPGSYTLRFALFHGGWLETFVTVR